VATATAQKEELPADGSVEQVVFDAVRLVIRATPVSIGESYGLQLDVTATTDSNREAWLFGMRDGLTMSGSFGHIATGGAGGGKFSEGGSASSVHVKGTLPRDMKRAYPRSSEPPIRPGSTLNVSLKTSICPQKTHGSSCREREIASVVLTVGASGVPTVRIKPGAAP
jgi:hypothetical protein